jgi:hypothetical protein
LTSAARPDRLHEVAVISGGHGALVYFRYLTSLKAALAPSEKPRATRKVVSSSAPRLRTSPALVMYCDCVAGSKALFW